jgi:hypothetical protein
LDKLTTKPGGGRWPEGRIARAACALTVRAKPPKRAASVERAVKIDAILPEVKVAARTAGLDDTQSALLAIANEKSFQAQLAKTREHANRKSQPRGKKDR